MGGKYPKPEYVASQTPTVLKHKRVSDKVIEHPRDQPGNIIIIHGVNDVGTGYNEVEAGLCEGLEQRLFRHFRPGTYTMPTNKDEVVDDPDAAYFKRKATSETLSPVIPFYWGYREVGRKTKTVNGQFTDRYGNRLDKDLSKGGGPFGNATSCLPDMWNRGVGAPMDLMHDALRPLRDGPGRMYMILAARRLAALIAMIRDYEEHDTVTLVAHSQGCLISLLAQAFLLERNERPADTLILTHPPYSLVDDPGAAAGIANFFSGGTDPAMAGHYDSVNGVQTLHGRLQTLVNIVQGLAKAKTAVPVFEKIDEATCGGMVEGRWTPGGDRDNRGKVYLYFSPEDMTVALDNMQGIGWQGVPDYIDGKRMTETLDVSGYAASKGYFGGSPKWRAEKITRRPLVELGQNFRQRVFTAKQRLDPYTRKVGFVLVGQPPHDFALRIKGEDDHAHVESSGRSLRATLPIARWPIRPDDKPEQQRNGIRTINGEPLAKPCQADMRGSQIDADKIPANSEHAKLKPADRGPCDEVDPITAAIAVTASGGLQTHLEARPDPTGHIHRPGTPQDLTKSELDQMTDTYNQEKNPKSKDPNDRFKIIRAMRHPDGKVMAVIEESPNAARRRWQHEVGAKSFHSAIFDSRKNHSHVTAYDVAIGSGKASSDPKFYEYLCAVADWRLKKITPIDNPRTGILVWDKFVTKFDTYLQCEPQWRRELIDGNADYYSLGVLPGCLPLLTGKLSDIVVSETTAGKRFVQANAVKEKS
jgi:pimeloyl-ACP methyl ester carboxylesterase